MPPIIDRLLVEKRPVIVFSSGNNVFYQFKDLPNHLLEQHQVLVKTDEDLFLCIEGTGRVYKLVKTEGSYNWNRVDRTIFNGYNFGALFFYINKNLYSFGGEGFWRYNGDLRKYSRISKEWDAIPVSEYIAKAFNIHMRGPLFYYFDTASKYFLTTGPQFEGVNVKGRFEHHSIYANKLLKLNVETGDWSVMGNLNDTGFTLLAQLPWGLLVDHENIIDIKNNQYLTLRQNWREKLQLISKHPSFVQNGISYCIDSTVYFGNLTNWIDSITVTKSDYIPLGKNFYEPLNTNKKSNFWLSFILITIFSGVTALLYIRIRRSRVKRGLDLQVSPSSTPVYRNQIFKSSKNYELLDEREIVLLQLILDDSNLGNTTTIEEINRCIGVKNKTVEIQKRLRGELLNSINQKWALITGSSMLLILKRRAEQDKRSFEYFINPQFLESLNVHFK